MVDKQLKIVPKRITPLTKEQIDCLVDNVANAAKAKLYMTIEKGHWIDYTPGEAFGRLCEEFLELIEATFPKPGKEIDPIKVMGESVDVVTTSAFLWDIFRRMSDIKYVD
jgi:hypothetical protein